MSQLTLYCIISPVLRQLTSPSPLSSSGLVQFPVSYLNIKARIEAQGGFISIGQLPVFSFHLTAHTHTIFLSHFWLIITSASKLDKMNYFISISTLISVAMAQNVAIGAPARGAHLTVGHEVDVQVQRPVSSYRISKYIYRDTDTYTDSRVP